MRDSVFSFLEKHNLLAQQIDMEECCDKFIFSMKEGLAGRKSCLPMIPSYCSPDFKVKEGEKVIVIDAGGTNFRTCLVSFDSSLKPSIEDLKKRSMPGIESEVSAKEFFSILADETERLIDKSNKIGFCFSYAAEILSNHDGIPIVFSKEIKAPEVIGKCLGENLLAEFKRRGYDVSQKKVIILNDTVTTLLAGQAQNLNNKYDSCIGFILGTGTNTAYVEKNSNIGKLPDSFSKEGYQIINVESGNMDLALGDIDDAFCKSTKDPEKYRFEKMISGAYLGKLSYFIIKKAVEEGLFSEHFAMEFAKLDDINTIQMSNFLEKRETPLNDCVAHNETDAQTLTDILTAHIERSACLTAINLSAVVLATDFGKTKPVLINADGSTYYKTEHLREFTEKYLFDFMKKKGRKVEITQIDSSPTIGSAIGALSI